jgi:hypothetical protein
LCLHGWRGYRADMQDPSSLLGLWETSSLSGRRDFYFILGMVCHSHVNFKLGLVPVSTFIGIHRLCPFT